MVKSAKGVFKHRAIAVFPEELPLPAKVFLSIRPFGWAFERAGWDILGNRIYCLFSEKVFWLVCVVGIGYNWSHFKRRAKHTKGQVADGHLYGSIAALASCD